MDSIKIENRGDVAVITLAHGRANALDLDLCRGLVQCIDEVAAGPARAALLTGSGGVFSAGVNLLRYLDDGPEYRDEFVPMISVLVRALFTFAKPLVVAVNGHAIGGGCIMACTADHRVMARGPSRMGVPELLVGVPFPTAALEAVRFVVPPQHIQSVVYSGRTYTAEDAHAIGLVDELVEADTLPDHAIATAHNLAALTPEAFTLIKRQLRAETLARMEASVERDVEIEHLWKEPTTLQNIQRYIEATIKRPK